MNKWFKRALIVVMSLAVLAGAAIALGSFLGDRKGMRQVSVAVKPVALPTDAASLERGRYLYATRGCVDCHGADGAGKVFMNDGGLYVRAPNISPGAGSVVVRYGVEDWVRTIRHGVKPDGRPAFIMPSEDYNRLTDADLGALVAYVKQLPPVAGGGTEAHVPWMVKTLYALGVVRDAAEKIDHTLPPATPVPEDGSPQHGAYVATMCIGCHGEKLSGGKIPGAPPSWPPAANLTPGDGSSMTHYASADQFATMLRTGKRPDGSAVSEVMPFTSLKALSDNDAKALYAYLKQLPPVAAGHR